MGSHSDIRESPLYAQFVTYQTLKLANVVITFLCLVLLIDYYWYYAQMKKEQWKFSSTIASFLFSSLWTKFVLEFVTLMVTPVELFSLSIRTRRQVSVITSDRV